MKEAFVKIIVLVIATLIGGPSFAGSKAGAPRIFHAQDPEIGTVFTHIESVHSDNEAPDDYMTISVLCFDKRTNKNAKTPKLMVVVEQSPICHFRVCDEREGVTDPTCKERTKKNELDYNKTKKIVVFHYSTGAECDTDLGLDLNLQQQCHEWQPHN